ncbi:MAG: tRNA uridine(34) 5-carboxymethylaminomethyl modification radical SAM/GNAT enzyme Elp3 [Patescibacteria group bacterium]
MDAHKIILESIAQNITNERGLRGLKVVAAGHSGKLLRNSDLVEAYLKLLRAKKIKARPELLDLLKKARIRTLSGVSPVAVLTKPSGCPGNCVFCPTERGMPKSYLSNEPAVMRARRAKFDPFRQVRDRLQALTACGHETSKIELIVMGGTFSAHPKRYQTWFIRRCLQALNSYELRVTSCQKSKTIENAKKANEKSKHRLVGLTLETRPDFITPTEVQRMLKLGCTRVEIGVQSLDDKVLRKVKRGHKVAESIRAIRLLKDAGLKVGIHMMPNLPGATPRSDLAMFRKIFEDPDFVPDQLKIYPTVLTEGTELVKLWRAKKWKPYSDKTLTKLLADIKQLVLPWVRLTRVIRDIPAESILAGSKITNLRQILQRQGVRCQCIRCREIRTGHFDPRKARIIKREYPASGGKEIFLSFEAEKKLISLLRLRFCKNGAYVRELHSYGAELGLGTRGSSGQHRGFGKRLITEAEQLTKKNSHKKLKIISGVGVRPYYRKLGYRLDREKIYMEKNL